MTNDFQIQNSTTKELETIVETPTVLNWLYASRFNYYGWVFNDHRIVIEIIRNYQNNIKKCRSIDDINEKTESAFIYRAYIYTKSFDEYINDDTLDNHEYLGEYSSPELAYTNCFDKLKIAYDSHNSISLW
jgi:hypothetical protein